jgi:hypothetical protein
MKDLEDNRTRRQLFRTVAAVVASVPLLVLEKKNGGAAGWNPGRHHGGGGGECCCLLKGTNVSTPSGERAVEDLQIGEEVDTLSGLRTIKWIGHNKFTKDDGRPWLRSVMPIRVARFAIDERSPHRDLYLSPEHCVFLNGVLIPAKHLVNHASIAPALPAGMAAIEYYHIELATHEVILAEGAPVESFLHKDLQRETFSNFVEYKHFHRGERQSAMTPYAPVVGYRSRREQAASVARCLISNVVDVRDPVLVARDQLIRRAEAMAA